MRSSHRVALLSAVLTAIAAGLLVLVLPGAEPHSRVSLPLWALLALTAVGAVVVGELRFRGDGQTLTLREAPLVLGLALADPGVFVVAHVLGSLLPRTVERLPPLKLAFNGALFLLEAAVGIALVAVLLDGPVVSPQGALVLLVVVVALDLLVALLVAAVIALATGSAPHLAPLGRDLLGGSLVSLAVTPLGLVALVLLERAAWALVPLGVVLAVLALGLRAQVARSSAARQDALTGLLTRRGLLEELDRGLTGGDALAVLLVDLRRFREVNEALGHVAGDTVLRQVGAALQEALPGRAVARLAADEFAAVVPADALPATCARVHEALDRTVEVDGLAVPVQVRTASALAPGDAADGDGLLRRAQVALHRAAARGDEHAAFDRADEPDGGERLALLRDLRSALDAGGLEVHYQPQVRLSDGCPVAVEALVRWTHPVRGRIGPDLFVPLAETAGLVDALTEHVLATALADVARWRSQGLLEHVAVNLSARSVADPDLPAQVARALEAAGVPAEALVLELTETAVTADADRVRVVFTALRELGVRLSLDDFGTGYSSLSHLRQLPVDEVKVDRSFVLDLPRSAPDQAVVRAAVDLAHDLGLTVVVEGVEDAETLALLTALGAESAQGYHLCRPVPAADLTAWLVARAAVPVVPGPRTDSDLPAARG